MNPDREDEKSVSRARVRTAGKASAAGEARELARNWDLDPTWLHLNHGSFGACPRGVLAAQAELRARLECDPMGFFITELEPLWDEARRELAKFVGAPANDIVFLPNATTAVSTVLRSLGFAPGDEGRAWSRPRSRSPWQDPRSSWRPCSGA
jgi:selenocysteine lyase/cysteine desulfurase